MKNLERIMNLLKQRRVWASLIGSTAIILNMANVNWNMDVLVLTGLLTDTGGALAVFVVSALSLWSYLDPKKK